MYCYKDMTFCPKEAGCANVKCPRNYEHCKDAGNTPVCYFIMCPMDCTEFIPIVKENGNV